MTQKNEGEGNRTAARHYNESAEAHARSGRVAEAAAEAEAAVDGPEGASLEAARREAASHAKEHDPEEMRDHKEKA